MHLIVDVQGFIIEKNKFICKELATFDGKKITHNFFKAPFRMRLLNEEFHRQAIWLMANHHGLNWNHGFTPLHEFHNIIQNVTKNAEAVYVKGREKAQYIRKYSLAPVFEMDEHPGLPKLPPKCPHHLSENSICSLSNVFYLYENFIMQ